MAIPKLTLTQAKLTSVICWAVVVLFGVVAEFFPVKGLPLPLKIAVTVLLLATAATIIFTTLDWHVEKPDERAVSNNYKSNSMLYDIIFLLFGLYVVFGEKLGMETVVLTRGRIVLLFAVLNLVHDGLFLLYERFGK
ncbi:hypothetical protein [Agathobaculum sp.]|uniref:hypothetical protein n=1 Tax=Agathobaculum sp. TaxID=2048138 RepID=UPI002A7F665F|nr:hypothetical protein [Agathobaculum sp.]MDY3618024.1 hypothetical protein [Agathobaculum sp.]